ncbi:hypothetical protein MNV49_003787, partial [Pseudohyphozyma bogoriensis]
IATLSAIAETCHTLRSMGHRIVIVSSGAIGMGLHRMGLPAVAGGKKRAIGEKQALAAIGQGRLIALWDQLFGMLEQPIAQILITRNDIADRSRYLNATTTLSSLLSLGVIPIINENDTISVSEILHINKFGDNDTLSAIAAGMCGADYLFLLTDVEGLYEDNPRKVPGARRVTRVRDIEEVRRMVSTSTLGSSLGTGGMETKLIASELATAAGCATVITLGSVPSRIITIVEAHAETAAQTLEALSTSAPGVEFATGTEVLPPHTLFTPKPRPLTSRRFWILHGLTPRGTVYVDEGAYRAISRGERDGGGGGNGGRLLAAGVLRVEGTFAAGQAVRVCVIRGRWGNRGQGREAKEPSRPVSPDHFADRKEKGDAEDGLASSVASLDISVPVSTTQDQSVSAAPAPEEDVLEFGRGLTNYNSLEIDRIKGLRSSDIEKILGYSEAEHVVESVIEITVIEEAPPQVPLEVEIVSVDDHEAFVAKHLSDMGEEEEDFKVFTWKLKDYRRMEKKALSPEFTCGGHKWNVLLFPMGNSNGQANDMVSVYLNYGDQKSSEGWHVCAQFALAISNPNDPTVYIQSQAHHRFTNEEQDWGFTRFVELRKLFSVSEGRPKPIIENDETVITAFVRVLKDPTGVLWHNFHNYDSKKETDHVGLKNQGATCYMNSLLQSLFLTNAFRRAVYQIPTEEDTTDTVPLALQRVFYNLQTSDQSVGTTELTKSFGWKGFDSFLQHDVQEFNRVLCDKLEMKMKGTVADGEIKRLFSGTTKSYIKCIDIDFESARSEPFYDIQLNVKGLKGLEDSFKDYIQMETLEGENKYNAEGYGLQDAKKGVIFEAFPPVLHLQLKRFEYDMQRDQNVKINDRYEFPLEIDLAPYLEDKADRSESHNYKLHGVLVHSGDVHGGHYFVHIKPSADGRWLRFDDDRVVPVTDREVLEDNFGGESLVNGAPHPPAKPPLKGAMKRFTNAYMLVYIRETRLDDVLRPIPLPEVPEHLRLRLDQERKDQERRRRERDEQHLYLTTKVITEKTFIEHQGFDLATFDDRTVAATDLPTYRVPKNQTFLEFREMIAKEQNLPAEEIRLWVLVNRQNKTVRPDTPVSDQDPTLTMETVRDKMASRQHDLKLYLEHVDPAWTKTHGTESPIMVFVKHFDMANQRLAGVGHFYVHRGMRVQDLALMINQRQGYPPTTPLKVYEQEIKPNMIELMKMKATFLQSEIQDGDIVCFQVDNNDSQDPDKQSQFTTPIQFYDFFLNRVNVTFRPKERDEHDANVKPDFELVLSKKNTYEQMATKVAEHLGWDPLKLRFTQSNGQNGAPKSIVRRQSNHTVAELIQPGYMATTNNLLYYEMLEVSIIELETKKSLRIAWVGLFNKEESSHSFLLPKNTTVGDVASEHLGKQVKLSPEGSQQIRIFEVINGREQKILAPSDPVRDIVESNDLFAEEVPLNEVNVDESERIVPVYHYSKDPGRSHGIPFQFVLCAGEKFSDTKKRLQARTATSDKDLAKMKFALIQHAMYQKPAPINDDDILYDHKWVEGDFLGLDHLDKRIRPAEKAVFIR